MNHHDIQLIEIGQREGYAKAIKDIVTWLRKEAPAALHDPRMVGDAIEAKWGKQ